MENTLRITKGYINGELVEAREYNGMDAGLDHYTYKGKTYSGNVGFTNPISTEVINY